MGRYILRRLIYMVVVILVVSVITFGLMHAVPGGPFTREKKLPPEIVAILEERYHLDDPLWKQYVDYISFGSGLANLHNLEIVFLCRIPALSVPGRAYDDFHTRIPEVVGLCPSVFSIS